MRRTSATTTPKTTTKATSITTMSNICQMLIPIAPNPFLSEQSGGQDDNTRFVGCVPLDRRPVVDVLSVVGWWTPREAWKRGYDDGNNTAHPHHRDSNLGNGSEQHPRRIFMTGENQDTYPPEIAWARFHDLMDRMLRSSTPSPKMSSRDACAGYSGTRTPSRTSEDASRKRRRASHGLSSSDAPRTPQRS